MKKSLRNIPLAFVGILRYEGAIDNHGWVPVPKALLKPALAPALEAGLEGKPVPIERAEPWGCSIKRGRR